MEYLQKAKKILWNGVTKPLYAFGLTQLGVKLVDSASNAGVGTEISQSLSLSNQLLAALPWMAAGGTIAYGLTKMYFDKKTKIDPTMAFEEQTVLPECIGMNPSGYKCPTHQRKKPRVWTLSPFPGRYTIDQRESAITDIEADPHLCMGKKAALFAAYDFAERLLPEERKKPYGSFNLVQVIDLGGAQKHRFPFSKKKTQSGKEMYSSCGVLVRELVPDPHGEVKIRLPGEIFRKRFRTTKQYGMSDILGEQDARNKLEDLVGRFGEKDLIAAAFSTYQNPMPMPSTDDLVTQIEKDKQQGTVNVGQGIQ